MTYQNNRISKVRAAIISAFVGISIGTLCSWFFSGLATKFTEFSFATPEFLKTHPNTSTATLICIVLYSLWGLIAYIGSLPFESTDQGKISLLGASIISYGVNALCFFFCSWYLKWMNDFRTILFAFVLFTIIFMAIWLLNYYINSKSVKEINQRLTKK